MKQIMTSTSKLVANAWENRTLPKRLAGWAAVQPEKPFFRCGDHWTTYGEANSRSRQLAAGLQDIGVRKGDRVALITQNTDNGVLSLLALAQLGAIAVPLNVFLKGEFLRFQLADCEASTLLTDADGLRTVTAIADQLPSLRNIVTLDGGAVSSTNSCNWQLADIETLLSKDVAFDAPIITPSDPMCIIYSSGTTGLPKGCVCSHGYYLASSIPALECGWFDDTDIVFTSFPIFHTAGYALILGGALQAGASVFLAASFSASGFLDQVRAIAATTAHGVGPMAMAILATPPREDDSKNSLRRCTWVPLPTEKQIEFEQRFGVDVISAAYGQTEATPISMLSVADSKLHREALGKPVSHMEVQIADENGEALQQGEIGEITIRPLKTEVMYSGYWGRPDATLASSYNLWHHTGDLGSIDENGFLQFSDRKKDMIRRRGENISSFELEAAIRKHPSIVNVAAFAVPSSVGEDDVKVCILAANEGDLEPEALFAFFGANLPYFAIPRYVEMLAELPVNANGRVMKHILRDAGIQANDWDFENMGFALSKQNRRS